ncbi:hypothetical protein B0H65DRAFT_208054 [Neurospora tetraspora]|uniref:Uncharacterized protein n=1 Tax=Neurospora tetraspora TaxID=94610 RepID=A0AAE0JGG3_9PEZI|nr:hypothetical protein B0H65DRAFT_208054 [Neurospora tetraspora]
MPPLLNLPEVRWRWLLPGILSRSLAEGLEDTQQFSPIQKLPAYPKPISRLRDTRRCRRPGFVGGRLMSSPVGVAPLTSHNSEPHISSPIPTLLYGFLSFSQRIDLPMEHCSLLG